MPAHHEPEGGRQPDEHFATDDFAATEEADGTTTGSSTGTYTDAGDESVPPGTGDAEASGY